MYITKNLLLLRVFASSRTPREIVITVPLSGTTARQTRSRVAGRTRRKRRRNLSMTVHVLRRDVGVQRIFKKRALGFFIYAKKKIKQSDIRNL